MANKLTSRILAIINSRAFYRAIIIFFVFEAAWIALTAAYPQAFDEQFHFGLIQLYSHHLSPFLSQQPIGADQFGAVTRDPSYLYHYLMSFPYRLIELVFKTQTYQIIALRLINIALFTYGLVLFRKLLIRAKVSKGLANVTILIFTLIPIAPQLAGQINYDNLLFPLVALTCLLCFKVIGEIKSTKLRFTTTITMLIVAGFSSLVKFAFLPIALAIVVFFSYYLLRYYKDKLPAIWRSLVADFKKTPIILRSILIALLIISAGMFIQRDVVNAVKYHSIDPNCASVMSVKSCQAYSAWYSDYTRHLAVVNNQVPQASHNILVYGGQWLYWMWYRLFFAVNGPNSSFTNYPPLPLPSAVALVIGLLGVIALIRYRKQLFHANAYVTFMLVASLLYAAALLVQGYATYQYTGILENMNGRYLIPILLLTGALFAKAFSIALKNRKQLKVLVACVVLLLFLQGGGIFTYISRSDDSWYWQNSKAIKANTVAKKITNKVVVKGRNTYTTSFWFFN